MGLAHTILCETTSDALALSTVLDSTAACNRAESDDEGEGMGITAARIDISLADKPCLHESLVIRTRTYQLL